MGLHVFTVVYADDEADVRESVATLLRTYGFIVYACADGNEAVAACSQLRPDAVLLDLNMPGVDGLSAARRIRTLGCARRIVALTGQSIYELRAKATLAGFDRLLSKPVCADALVQALIPEPDNARTRRPTRSSSDR
jgi:two-component system response regulator MprA